MKDFTFIDEYLEPCKKMIKDVSNPIALHIRRTDYAQYSHHPICDINYYKEALSRFDSDREVIIFLMILSGAYKNLHLIMIGS